MIEVVRTWFKRNLSDPEIVVLMLTLIVLFAGLIFLSGILMPIFVGVVIAYLLDGLVVKLESHHCPHFLAVLIVFLCALSLVFFAFFGLLPSVWHQARNLVTDLPSKVSQA